MTDCVVCDGLGCEHCPKVTREEETFSAETLAAVLLWDVALWLALLILAGWLL